MCALTIKTDRANGLADLVFSPDSNDEDLLNELHDTVVHKFDGISTRSDVRDSIVSIDVDHFDKLVSQLAERYRAHRFTVTIR